MKMQFDLQLGSIGIIINVKQNEKIYFAKKRVSIVYLRQNKEYSTLVRWLTSKFINKLRKL